MLAVDGYQRVTTDNIRVQLAGSRTEYPDFVSAALDQPDGSFNGHALRASYSHFDRTWEYSADYAELSPEFRADSGFISQVGVREASAFVQRRIRGGEDRWFRNLYIAGGVDSTREFNGDWTEWGADLGATYEGPRQTEISFNLAPNQEYFAGRTYHNFRHSFGVSTQRRRMPRLLLRNSGEASLQPPAPADFVTLNPGGTFNIGSRVPRDRLLLAALQHRERVSHLHLAPAAAKLLYHFIRRAFVRAVLHTRPSTSSRKSRELLTQFCSRTAGTRNGDPGGYRHYAET